MRERIILNFSHVILYIYNNANPHSVLEILLSRFTRSNFAPRSPRHLAFVSRLYKFNPQATRGPCSALIKAAHRNDRSKVLYSRRFDRLNPILRSFHFAPAQMTHSSPAMSQVKVETSPHSIQSSHTASQNTIKFLSIIKW